MIIRGMGVGGWNLHENFCMQAPQTVCMMIQAEMEHQRQGTNEM